MGTGYLVGEKGVWAWGVVGASVARVRVWGLPLLLGRVTMRLRVVWMGKGGGGLLEQKSLSLGTGPIDPSVSVAQSNRRSCGLALCAV